MARPSGPKNRCGGRWTDAKFNSFVKSNLRQASRKWAPINDCLKNARLKKGWYKCAGCSEEVPTTIKEEGSRTRTKNVYVDHIKPVIDPAVGFTTWDECIERMFSEEDNLQVLCKACHDIKTNEEKAIAAERRSKEKELGK